MLVEHLQHRDINAFRDAVSHGDVATVTRLLGLPHVKEQVDAPMFAFGQRAAHIAAKRPPMLEALIAAGANLNLMSEWEIGPYTVLDNATEETARLLLAGGVRLTPSVAARLGWIDELRQLLVANSHLVHARGGDGQCRRLLQRGAAADIFIPARLGDVALATQVLDVDPQAIAARINEPGYAPVPPLHIYCWTLGFGLSILRRGRVPLETRDPVHLSTPLGWAAFGSVHRRADDGDYPAVVDRLVAAEADINAPGNGEPLSLIAMAEGNLEVQATLRTHGAKG